MYSFTMQFFMLLFSAVLEDGNVLVRCGFFFNSMDVVVIIMFEFEFGNVVILKTIKLKFLHILFLSTIFSF